MPWQHCGQQVPDDAPCPSCGAPKASWTVRLDVTRAFRLSGTPDTGAQAEALSDAADTGSAFCEDCQAKDNSEPPPDPPPEEPSDPDEEAQIETLEAAADSGAPFCEECQKQDNEAA